MKTIFIGTRGSDLALKQTEIVKGMLLKTRKDLHIEVKIIKTEGDINQAPIPLDVVGKGWFTKEIETALLQKDIDIAIHSLKDLPESLPEGLVIGAYCNREDPRDCLVSKNNLKVKELLESARVGTDSLRRRAQVLAMRSDLTVESIRGNVPTRVKKMDDGNYDAVILAVAGLKRLGMENRIAQYFEVEEITPAPGQGVLAIEIRNGDTEIENIISSINDTSVERAAEIEREFSARVDGGCKQPVGAYAEVNGDMCTLSVMAANSDGTTMFRKKVTFNFKDKVSILEGLEKEIKEKGL